MAEDTDGTPEADDDYEFDIVLDGDHFGVRCKSPYNSIHRTSGFKTVHDAEAWIAETRLLMKTFG